MGPIIRTTRNPAQVISQSWILSISVNLGFVAELSVEISGTAAVFTSGILQFEVPLAPSRRGIEVE